jgi:hypothetical protein
MNTPKLDNYKLLRDAERNADKALSEAREKMQKHRTPATEKAFVEAYNARSKANCQRVDAWHDLTSAEKDFAIENI